MSARKPLEGVKVVDLSTMVAAPTCAKLLADYGAEVIKVESIEGDYRRIMCQLSEVASYAHFMPHNSGKKAVSINLKTPEGKEIMHKLLSDADVFITNVRFPALERLGLDHTTLREKYPGLIYGIITAYGEFGEESALPGFDSVAFWAKSGALVDHNVKENKYLYMAPSSTGDSVAALTLYSSILTALYNKRLTGEGDYCPASLYNCGAWMYGIANIDAQESENTYPLSTTQFGFGWNTYRCADGEYLQICFYNFHKELEPFLSITGLLDKYNGFEDGNEEAYCWEHNAEIHDDLEKVFETKTAGEWISLIRPTGLCVNKINHYLDVIEDKQAWVNNYLQKVEMPDGNVRTFIKSPVRLESQPEAIDYGEAPTLGGNTEEYLLKMGYTKEQIEALEASGAVYCNKNK